MNQAITLYEQDFYGWIQHHIALLRQGRWAEIDTELLIEELDGMARRDRHELVSHLIILIAHLLKWQYQAEHRSRSWRSSIIEQRKQVTRQLKLSPSLKPFLMDAIQEAYPDAVDIAMKETRLPKFTFPNTCPYTLEQLFDDEYYP
jgi:Domain of unknown function DUF29